MRGFCFRVTGFVLLQVLLFAVLVWNPEYPDENGFLAATIDKHRRLERTPSPRVLLVGGSNVAFGLQSPILEQELSLPVVNMGFVAGLGPGFLLNEVAEAVGTGDIVVLSFEDSMLGATDYLLHQRQLLEYRPASWWFCPRARRIELLLDHGVALAGSIVRRSLGLARREVREPPAFPYRRDGFNEWGDYVLHHRSAFRLDQVPSDSPLLTPRHVPTFSPRLRQRLEVFIRLCHNRGARICYTFAPRPRAHWEAQRAAIEIVASELRALSGLEVLDDPADHVYDLRLFADTADHLTDEGGRQRSARVAVRLKASAGSRPGTQPRTQSPHQETGDNENGH